jgi:hypothetical protein
MKFDVLNLILEYAAATTYPICNVTTNTGREYTTSIPSSTSMENMLRWGHQSNITVGACCFGYDPVLLPQSRRVTDASKSHRHPLSRIHVTKNNEKHVRVYVKTRVNLQNKPQTRLVIFDYRNTFSFLPRLLAQSQHSISSSAQDELAFSTPQPPL